MKFHVVTLFPEVVEAYCEASILGRAQKNKILKVNAIQLRDFANNKWGKVDERPFGGGPGMVLRAEPIVLAVRKIKSKISNLKSKNSKLKAQSSKLKIIITSAGGKRLTNSYAKNLAKKYDDVIIVCGRYEGIDARVKKILKAEEISVGDAILTGGEVPAMAIIDAAARHIPGVLGKIESIEESRVASHDAYTRPEVLEVAGKKYRVPKVLLSGHHAKIDELRGRKRSSPK